MPEVSMILLTKNAGSAFSETLHQIFSQRLAPTEVLVIDSGSTDGTVSLCQRFPIRLVHIQPEEFGHGKTRNLGARLAKSELLVFLTQDAIPASENWLSTLVKPLWKDQRLAGVYGRQLPRNSDPFETFCRNYTYPPTPYRHSSEDLSKFSVYHILFSNVNSAIRRELLIRFPFDETLLMCEDQDWARRILHGGYEILYEPNAAVYHSHHDNPLQLFRRSFDAGVSFQQMSSDRIVHAFPKTGTYLREEIRFLGQQKKRFWIFLLFPREAIHAFGFLLGYFGTFLPPHLKRRLSFHNRFWLKEEKKRIVSDLGSSSCLLCGRIHTDSPARKDKVQLLGERLIHSFRHGRLVLLDIGLALYLYLFYLGAHLVLKRKRESSQKGKVRILIDGTGLQVPLSGLERYTQSLLQSLPLQEPHWDFIFFCRDGVIPIEERSENVFQRRDPSVLAILQDLLRTEIKGKADLYHLTHQSMRLSINTPLFLCRSSVLTLHDLILVQFPGYHPLWRRRICRALLKRGIQRADAVIVDSKTVRDKLVTELKVPTAKVHVVPPGISSVFFAEKPSEEIEAIKKHYGLKVPCLLSVGKIFAHKNQPFLLNVLAELRQRGVDCQLVLVGESYWEPTDLQIRSLARELKLLPHLLCLGHVPDEHLPLIYRASTVFLFPSLAEGFGLPPLEAMASGIPVVASDRESLPEVLGEEAVLLDPFNVASWVEAILKILNHETYRESLIERGLERARQFSQERMAHQTLEVYREVLALRAKE